MKLNNRGWGLNEMLLLSGVLVIFLLIAFYYIFHLFDNFKSEMNINSDDYYIELEEKLENQALIYLNDYYDDYLTSDNIIVTRSILKSYNLDIDLEDKSGRDCNGYVIANKSHGIINKKAYIKCNKYETEGYVE
ncbi:MAG: hypothetical protein NC483_05255 [Ruminococcus sp.]|nr:hypothetical protein [Ruminococcus sp.]